MFKERKEELRLLRREVASLKEENAKLSKALERPKPAAKRWVVIVQGREYAIWATHFDTPFVTNYPFGGFASTHQYRFYDDRDLVAVFPENHVVCITETPIDNTTRGHMGTPAGESLVGK